MTATTRRRRQAAGLCVHCGKAKATRGRQLCRRCNEANAEAARARYLELRDAGICTVCGLEPTGGMRACETCRTRIAGWSKGRPESSGRAGVGGRGNVLEPGEPTVKVLVTMPASLRDRVQAATTNVSAFVRAAVEAALSKRERTVRKESG